jgi:holliday junction DNA helicase RuvA
MISRISGKLIEKGANFVILELSGISYEVSLPTAVMQRLDDAVCDGNLSLVTFHYLHVEPSKSIPILIGFLNEVERDFFEVFITVSGIGPRAALKALDKPISLIAKAIDEGDLDFLRSLPGIGTQRAKEIVAKLQNKVGRFGLIQDSKSKSVLATGGDLTEEAVAVLMQLQYKRQEALNMIKKAMENAPDVKSTEELLNFVYKQRKSG